MRQQVEAKISDGDVSGAVCLASSSDKLMMILGGLQATHPPAPSTSCFPDPLVILVRPYLFHSPWIPASSAAGPDNLCPQHLKELTSHLIGDASSQLIEALTSLLT